MGDIVITEAQLNRIVENAVIGYLNEGRKLLKLGGNSQEMPPQPSMPPMDMGGVPNGGGMPPMDMGGAPDGGMPPMDGAQDGNVPPMGDDGATAGDSQFDTNFDAGVEADEDTDPKKYIQQLTGKLSQSLSKYNNDNGMDNGLCKYVANMIVKQAAKGLDEKDRKDIIKAINTTAQDDSEEMPDDEDEENPMDDASQNTEGEMPMDDGFQDMQQPLQERYFLKKQLRKIFEEINPSQEERMEETPPRRSKKNTPFNGKKFL